MSDNDLDDLIDSNPEPIEAEAVEAPEAEAVEATEATEEVAQVEEPAPAKDEQTVPLATFLEMRDEMKGLKRQLQGIQHQPQPTQPQPLPDVLENPEGFVSSIEARVSQATANAQYNVSEAMAREAHGDDLVNEAFQAASEQNLLGQFKQSRHPYGDLVKWHKQQQLAAEIQDPDTYREQVRKEVEAEVKAKLQAEQVAQTLSSPSLARETSIGGRRTGGVPDFTDLDDILG